ncbi:MAG: PilT/PilU family type 4a pilus ATPase [Candidatus Dojkabacteria bacterium]|nr:PilT/PilU family type 4a pilus ATPase [Candidatus Dojkabacteria bacterium]
MDNNTAQNNGFSYPDLSQSGTASQPTTSSTPVNPASDDAQILSDLANQLKEIQKADSQPEQILPKEQAIQTPTPVATTQPVQQEPSVTQVKVQGPVVEPDIPVVNDQPTQPEEIPEQSQVKPEEIIPEPPVPVVDTQPVQPQVAAVVPEIKQEETAPQSPPPTVDSQPRFDLPSQPAPAPTNIMTEDSIGIVRSTLADIMPGEKVPRALQRTPKEKNLSKPFTTPKENFNTVRKDVLAKQQPAKEQVLDETPKHLGGIDELLKYAIEKGASDLHISVGYPPIIRVDGQLENVNESIVTPQDAEELILPILTDEKKELLEVNREIDLAYFYQGNQSARFRVNAYFTMKNLAGAFRLIPSRVKTIEELLIPQIYHRFGQLKQGLILITGPTGHGKSTTLAAILEDINRTRSVHIVTIEDPIEYVFEGKKALIDQREMNDDTHSWNIALRSALRQDPDVILVGEMRDYETIAAAITLAETGHLVFATLHTNNSAQTIDRIIDVFPENQQPQIRSQLSNILEAIVSQRLVPLDKGGRRAVSEILIANPAVRNLIREGKTHQIDNVIRTSSDIGMVSLERSLVNLVREGVISIEKAQEYSIYPEEVLRLLKS